MTDSARHVISADEIALGDLTIAEFPGIDDWETFRVFLSADVHEQICSHARENDRIELCGVIVGNVFKDYKGPFLMISGAIRGEHSANQSAQVTFTQDTWAHIHDVMDTKYSDQRIVGWYHTHPGFGIFLSAMDLFIHVNFFDLPWQVAFVIDPLSGDEGFFCWKEGKAARMRRYWIGSEERILLNSSSVAAGAGNHAQKVKEIEVGLLEQKEITGLLFKKFRRFRTVVTLLLAAFAALLVWSHVTSERWRESMAVRLKDASRFGYHAGQVPLSTAGAAGEIATPGREEKYGIRKDSSGPLRTFEPRGEAVPRGLALSGTPVNSGQNLAGKQPEAFLNPGTEATSDSQMPGAGSKSSRQRR